MASLVVRIWSIQDGHRHISTNITPLVWRKLVIMPVLTVFRRRHSTQAVPGGSAIAGDGDDDDEGIFSRIRDDIVQITRTQRCSR